MQHMYNSVLCFWHFEPCLKSSDRPKCLQHPQSGFIIYCVVFQHILSQCLTHNKPWLNEWLTSKSCGRLARVKYLGRSSRSLHRPITTSQTPAQDDVTSKRCKTHKPGIFSIHYILAQWEEVETWHPSLYVSVFGPWLLYFLCTTLTPCTCTLLSAGGYTPTTQRCRLHSEQHRILDI